jgi:hypothetical protein
MKLQEYNGYTVDYRLKQFRACPGGWENLGWIEFIEFESEKGQEILSEMMETGFVTHEELHDLIQGKI